MIELIEKLSTVDLPFTVKLHGVSDELFDELVDEDTRAELIDGVLIVHSPASIRHDDIRGFLHGIARPYAEMKAVGKVLGPESIVHLATCRKFAPDLYFILQANVPVPFPKKQFHGSPDLVMEILSPSNRLEDINEKRPAYQEAKVSEIWLIDPDGEEIEVDRLRKKRFSRKAYQSGVVKSEVMPGFWIDAAWLWQETLPNVLPTIQQILDN